MELTPNLSEQRETLERLREEMEQAKALHDGARDLYEQTKKKYDDDRIPTPPREGLQRVMRLYGHTMHSYRLALWRFNQYILNGDLPENQKDPSTQI